MNVSGQRVLLLLLATVTLLNPVLSRLTPDLEVSLLELHRRVRAEAKINTNLVWDANVASFAEVRAQAQVGNCEQPLSHVGRGTYGENLAKGTGTINDGETPIRLMGLWASQGNPGEGKYNHYTQVIWAQSTKVGCGAVEACGMVFLSCNYSPAGNVIGQNPWTGNPGMSQPPSNSSPSPSIPVGSNMVPSPSADNAANSNTASNSNSPFKSSKDANNSANTETTNASTNTNTTGNTGSVSASTNTNTAGNTGTVNKSDSNSSMLWNTVPSDTVRKTDDVAVATQVAPSPSPSNSASTSESTSSSSYAKRKSNTFNNMSSDHVLKYLSADSGTVTFPTPKRGDTDIVIDDNIMRPNNIASSAIRYGKHIGPVLGTVLAILWYTL